MIKIIGVGDELVFNLEEVDLTDLDDFKRGKMNISVSLTEKAGRQAVLRISAIRSIKIETFKMQRVSL